MRLPCSRFTLPLPLFLPLSRSVALPVLFVVILQKVCHAHEAPMEVITGQKCSNVCDLRSNNNWLQFFLLLLFLFFMLLLFLFFLLLLLVNFLWPSWRSTTFCLVVFVAVRVHYWPPMPDILLVCNYLMQNNLWAAATSGMQCIANLHWSIWFRA